MESWGSFAAALTVGLIAIAAIVRLMRRDRGGRVGDASYAKCNRCGHTGLLSAITNRTTGKEKMVCAKCGSDDWKALR